MRKQMTLDLPDPISHEQAMQDRDDARTVFRKDGFAACVYFLRHRGWLWPRALVVAAHYMQEESCAKSSQR
jgi:hypothetical protein